MKKHLISFIHCGILGWCLEITFTAVQSLRRREKTLKGNTSVWMFPIYGLAVLLTPICRLVRRFPVLVRGLVYTFCIFSAEYATGYALAKRDLCPWDYSGSRWNIKRLIRLDYAPFWFFTGLLFERLLAKEPGPRTH